MSQETIIAVDPAETLQHPPDSSPMSGAEPVVVPGPGEGERLRLGGLLGEGGMGRVHRATQSSLGREVAVKGLRPEVRGPQARRLLLQEAWVTGALEHPNIVPLYALSSDEGGWPLLVLKRIEGEPWSQLLGDPEAARRHGASDLLAWNLGVLQQVCQAVHFAHSRGILHRDLKPANVMIGAFGEVYLVDWGLAVSLRAEHAGRIPLARDEHRVAGTPHYLAPEMLRGDGAALSPRTDVYLLGGLLYEILTGEPPHAGADVQTVFAGIPDFLPLFPEEAPSELAALCSAALSAEPAQRPASAQVFQRSLQAFLDHRGAVVLVAEARRSLRALGAALALAPSAAARAEQYRLYGVCRLGFQQARRIWPAHPTAAAGLRAATLAMLDQAVAQRDHRAAAVLLADLDGPPPEALRAALDALESEEAQHAAEVQRLREDIDPRLGQRTRVFIGTVAGCCWSLSPVVLHALDAEISHRRLLGYSAAMLVGLVALAVWARESMGRTAFNRSIMAGLCLVPVVQIVLALWAGQVGQSGATALTLSMVGWALIAALIGITVDRRVLSAAIAYLLAFGATTLWPAHIYPAIALSNLWLMVVVLVSWAWPMRDTLFTREPP